MCSRRYDILDVGYYVLARNVCMAHSFTKQETAPSCTRRLIWEQHVPMVAKQCCRDMPAELGKLVRSALRRWHDAEGRLPGLIADPLFYTPPYMETHPYVGTLSAPSCASSDNGVPTNNNNNNNFGSHYAQSSKALDMPQLMMLLVINHRHYRDLVRTGAVKKAAKTSSATPSSCGAVIEEVPLEIVHKVHQHQQHAHHHLPDEPINKNNNVSVYSGFEDWLRSQNKDSLLLAENNTNNSTNNKSNKNKNNNVDDDDDDDDDIALDPYEAVSHVTTMKLFNANNNNNINKPPTRDFVISSLHDATQQSPPPPPPRQQHQQHQGDNYDVDDVDDDDYSDSDCVRSRESELERQIRMLEDRLRAAGDDLRRRSGLSV
eukprot:PhM_4_TR7466/c1_g1_i1/m.30029